MPPWAAQLAPNCARASPRGSRATYAAVSGTTTRGQLELAVVAYVAWFNNDRLHEALGDIPPVEFEQLARAASSSTSPPARLRPYRPGRTSAGFAGIPILIIRKPT